MSSPNRSLSQLSIAALASLMLFAFGVSMGAQTTAVGNVRVKGLPDDWTHHHLVFSNPGTEEDAIKNGQHDHWLKVVNNPRYVIQQLKKGSATQGPAGPEVFRIQGIRGDNWRRGIGTGAKTTKIEKDWSVSLGGTPATATGTFTGNPTAAQTVSVNGTALTASVSTQATGTITIATASCFENGDGVTINGVTLTTNATGGSGALTVSANPGNFTNESVGGVTYQMRTGAPGATTDRVEIGTTTALTAQNLAAAINDTATCGTGAGTSGCYGTGTTANPEVTASVSGTVITLTGRCGGTGTVTLTPDSTDIKTTTAWNGGNNGTTSGTNFALNSTATAPTNANIATQIGAAITANTNTGVTDTVATNVVHLTAVTGGTTGNVAVTSTADSGVTVAGLTGGTNGTNTGTSFAVDFNTTDNATNLAAAIARSVPVASATTSSGATVTVIASGGTAGNSIAISETATNFAWNGGATVLSGGTNASVQPNAYPAKYGVSLTGASCSDFAIYPTGQAGSSTAATIVSYDNLYTGGCLTGTVPNVSWAYNTGTGESVTTSPIISQDGTQIAFIESNNASPATASLVLIQLAAGTGETVTAPLTLTNQLTAGAYQTCTPTPAAPCMYTIPFANGKDDQISSPFYDYTGDVLYVGDASGNLHRFTGVFNGAPAEDTTSPWPVALNTVPNGIASPIWDDTWNALFVGDLGGKLYCVTQTAGACSTATSIGGGWLEASTLTATGGQIADAPLINSSANYVLAFVNTASANEILGFSEQFFVNSPGTVAVGAGATGKYLYSGSFDNVYYDSPSNTGNLYVVGNTSGATTGANLYQVGLSGGNLTGTVTTAVTGLSTIGANPWPSPLTEFCNNGASACGAVAAQSGSTCTTTTGAKTVTCTTGNFTSAVIGQVVTATDIPAGSTITAVGGTTSITVSANATAHTTAGTASVAAFTSPGTDYVFFSVNEGKVAGCTATAGNGCILSYNVTNSGAVVIAGTGQNLVTPVTNGCWATGGLSIDNSAITTGASQIYFVNLNGAAAGGGANSGTRTSTACTAATGNTNAVQASQANP